MATDRPLLRRRRVFAAKVETTTGTAISLSASDGAMNVFDRDLSIDIEAIERERQGSFSKLPTTFGGRKGSFDIETELVGNGASGLPLWSSTLLAASGWTVSTATYSPDSTSAVTLTAAMYADGQVHTLAGCRTNWTMTFASGKPARCRWTVMGKYVEPTSDTILAPTYPTVIPPRFSAATLTIGGTPYKISEVVINANNDLVMREDANADDDATRSDGTGYHACAITNRDVQITLDPEAIALGTHNWYQDWLDGDEAALSIVLGADSNNTITIAAPKLQIINAQPGDRNGIMVDQLTCRANSNAANDNELTFAFS